MDELNPAVLSDIKTIINTSREKAIRAVDTERVLMYWHIGQRIEYLDTLKNWLTS